MQDKKTATTDFAKCIEGKDSQLYNLSKKVVVNLVCSNRVDEWLDHTAVVVKDNLFLFIIALRECLLVILYEVSDFLE